MLDLRDRLTAQITAERHVAPTSVKKLKKISPQQSAIAISVPLSDEHFAVRLKYRTATGHVRVGRCLEDLDTIAGVAAYKHNTQLGSGLIFTEQNIKYSDARFA